MTTTPPFAAHVGRPQTVEALGQTWTLARWTRGVQRDFLEWARPLLPDPRDTVQGMLDRIPATPENATLRREIVGLALEKAEVQLTPADPRVIRLLETTDGMIAIVRLLLLPAHKDATEDDVYDLVMAVGPAKMNELLMSCAGMAPPPKDEGGIPGLPAVEPRPQRTDWAAIDRSLFRETGLTPAQADDMTLSELAVLCEKDEKAVTGEAEMAEHLNRLAGMNDIERLWYEP